MLDVLSKRAFLRFELPIHRIERPPPVDGRVEKWKKQHRVPPLIELEGVRPLAEVFWAWNEDGFYAAFHVPSRPGPPVCDVQQWWKKDGLRLCIDTRDARDNKRATRFCHLFYMLPLGGGPRGQDPVVGLHRMSRAKEPPAAIDVSRICVAAAVSRRGYSLEVAIPAACLNGWNPAEHPRIGVFYKVKDLALGSQTLTVGDELGWNVDPSTWATGVLVR